MKRYLTFVTVFFLLAVTVGQGFAALRIGPKDAAPFLLKEVAVEEGVGWFDAQTWLNGLNGEATYSAQERRLFWRKGKVSAELGVSAPFVVREGRPLASAEPPRLIGSRLAVSEKFIRESGADFAGVDFRIDSGEGRLTRRIAIDAAYGGSDFGPRAVDETPTKKLVAALARTIAESFLREGFEVRMTRTDDVPLTTARRAAIANNWNSDLFLSVQVSGDRRPLAKGYEVFFATPPSLGSDPNRWDAGQKPYADHSRRWAEEIKAALGSALPTFDRGATMVSSPLLSAVTCPAAIIAAGNVNSASELELLMNEAVRRKIADALVDAANRFLSR